MLKFYLKIQIYLFLFVLTITPPCFALTQADSQTKIRVLLSDSDNLDISSQGAFIVSDLENKKNVFCLHPSQTYSFRLNSQGVGLFFNNQKVTDFAGTIEVLPVWDMLSFSGKGYRGKFKIIQKEKFLRLVNELGIEKYLYGVVPEELYSTQIEAMKAQAVLARTYAIIKIAKAAKKNNSDYDILPTIFHQVYSGTEVEEPLSNKAVDETKGLVLFYNGKIVTEVLYHSTCGGHTANNEEVYDGKPVPYLRGVWCCEEPKDLDLINETSIETFLDTPSDDFFCKNSPYFRWSFKNDDIIFTLGNISGKYEILERGPCARAIKLKMDNKEFKFDNIRGVFKIKHNGQEAYLFSTLFIIKKKEDNFILSGGGWGHGVGLCQWGAIGMAKRGFDYKEILMHYFLGTIVQQLEPS